MADTDRVEFSALLVTQRVGEGVIDLFGRDVRDEVFEWVSEDFVQLFAPVGEGAGVGVREPAARVDDVDDVVNPVERSLDGRGPRLTHVSILSTLLFHESDGFRFFYRSSSLILINGSTLKA